MPRQRSASHAPFLESLPEEAPTRIGIANGNPMSVCAAAFHIAGPELHHLASIRTNYLAEGAESARPRP